MHDAMARFVPDGASVCLGTALEANAGELASIAHDETGLPVTPRLAQVEIPTTAGQIRAAAVAARERTWRLPTLSPSARVASQLAPLPGVVAVFGPNNFPIRFNCIGGGDGGFSCFGEGRFISRSFDNCGVVIMKITSNTNAKSSNGVIFSSLSEL